MVFQIKKVSDHGTANPIVARLSIQTQELIQFCSFEKEMKDKIFELYHDRIQPRVLTCDEIAQEISSEILVIAEELNEKGFSTQSHGRIVSAKLTTYFQ